MVLKKIKKSFFTSVNKKKRITRDFPKLFINVMYKTIKKKESKSI